MNGYAHSRWVLLQTAKLLGQEVKWSERFYNSAHLNDIYVWCGPNGVELDCKKYWMGHYNNPHFLARVLQRRTVRR